MNRVHPIARAAGLLAVTGLLLTAPRWANAFDQWGDNGSTPAGGGNGSGPPGDPGSNPDGDKNGQGSGGDPVDLLTGQINLSATDFSIVGRMPLGVSRVYRSGSSYQGMFGRGWNLLYNERVLVLATNGNLLLRRNNSDRLEFLNAGNNTYLSPKGCYDTLSRSLNGGYVLRQRHGTQRIYNSDGSLAEIRDPDGNQILLTYQPGGKQPINAVSDYSHFTNAILVARDYRLSRIEIGFNGLPSGRFIEFFYDANGRATNATDFTGRSWTYQYDPGDRGLLLSVTTPPVPGFPTGQVTRYTYSATNQYALESITDPAGQKYLVNHYDSSGRIVKQIYGPITNTFGYPSSNLRTFTNGNGYRIERTFDTGGNVLTLKQYTAGLRPTDPPFFLTQYTYTTNFEVAKVVLPASNVVTKAFDALGNVLEARRRVTDTTNNLPQDIFSTFTYEPRFGHVKTSTDPNGNTTTNVYDYEQPAFGTTNGWLMRVLLPAVEGTNAVLSFAYNQYGQLEFETNAIGTVTRLEYDSTAGFLLKRISAFGSPLAATNVMTYDPRGNLLTSPDPLGNTTSFVYDNLNRVVLSTNAAPFSLAARTYYTANGKVSRIERQTGDASHPWQTNSMEYDVLDRLIFATNDLRKSVRFGYDFNGNRVLEQDANGHARRFVFDERDLTWQSTDVLTNVSVMAYDRNGNLLTVTDAQTNVTRYVYDAFDRRVTNVYPDLSFEAFVYDKSGNALTRQTRSGQVFTNSYDPRQRLVFSAFPDGKTNAFKYDIAGRLADLRDNSGVLNYAYDALSRLTATTDAAGRQVGYSYDRGSRRTKVVYPDASAVTWNYDNLNRPETIYFNTNSLVAQFTYDALGRRRQMAYGNGTRVAYEYDWANRIATLTHSNFNNASLLFGFGYTYDDGGALLAKDASGGLYPGHSSFDYDRAYQLTNAVYPAGFPLGNAGYGYDKLGNRKVSVQGGSVQYLVNLLNQYTNVAGATFVYDNNGNLASDGNRSLGYDVQNRLVSASAGSTNASYQYDALGRRTSRTVNGQTTQFTYNGDTLIAEYDGSGNLLRKYVHGPAVDEPLALIATNSVYFYHADVTGTVLGLSGNTGNLVEQYVADSFGRVVQYLSALGNRFLFAGREFDTETGLYYVRARHYDPKLGRFIQADPVRFVGGLNLYAYCANNPLSFLDPLGLDKGPSGWTRFFGALQAIGGLAEAGAGFLFAAVTAETGIGAVAGVGVGLHGLDQFQAGLRAAFSGESTETLTSTALQEAGVPPGWAHGIDAGISIVGTAGIGFAEAAANAAKTGTVWDAVRATQPAYEGTVVPRSFELGTANGSVWVHGNATEHIAEYATSMLNHGVSPELVNLGTQQQIRGLQAAVEAATANGVPYNQLINVGGWELKFAAPRAAGQLPALIHALPK